MQKYRVNHEALNDGILFYGSVEPKLGKGNKKIGEEFNQKGFLYYKQLTAREGDIISANALGYVIDLKVKVFLQKDVNSKDKVKIGEDLYSIGSMDNDTTYLYLYLQKVGG